MWSPAWPLGDYRFCIQQPLSIQPAARELASWNWRHVRQIDVRTPPLAGAVVTRNAPERKHCCAR